MEYYEQHTDRNERLISRRFGAKAVIRDGRRASFEGNSPTVSRFSSRGPDIMDSQRKPADVLKPDILAPGHQIWAAWSPMSVSDPMLKGESFGIELDSRKDQTCNASLLFDWLFCRTRLCPNLWN